MIWDVQGCWPCQLPPYREEMQKEEWISEPKVIPMFKCYSLLSKRNIRISNPWWQWMLPIQTFNVWWKFTRLFCKRSAEIERDRCSITRQGFDIRSNYRFRLLRSIKWVNSLWLSLIILPFELKLKNMRAYVIKIAMIGNWPPKSEETLMTKLKDSYIFCNIASTQRDDSV